MMKLTMVPVRSFLFTLLLVVACGGKGASPTATVDRAAAKDSVTGGEPELRDIAMASAAVQHGGVKWEAAVAREVASTIEVPGQLVPNEDRTSRLGAPARGRIVDMHVQAGDRVSAGQPLVSLQSAEASAALSDYTKAVADRDARRVAVTYARTARERAERLLAAKAVARQEVERAQADEALAASELSRAEAEVVRAQSTARQLGTNMQTGAMVIRSPLAGVVLARDAVPGAVVEAGAPLVTVSDVSTLWIDVAVPERAAGVLRVGSSLRFTVPAFPGDTQQARVLSLGGALDPQTRMLPIRALVRNGDTRRRLRPQMFATVWFVGTDRHAGVGLPESAVMLLDQRPVVFIARPGKTPADSVHFERRDVEVTRAVGGTVQVLRGLNAGDLVVTEGAFAVKSAFSRSKMSAEG